MASNWPSRSSGQNGLTPRIFTHSSFRPRFLFNETTMRALNPLTVYAVILLKKPIYNCIVRDTILRSGARSSLLTRANRNTASPACLWSDPPAGFAPILDRFWERIAMRLIFYRRLRLAYYLNRRVKEQLWTWSIPSKVAGQMWQLSRDILQQIVTSESYTAKADTANLLNLLDKIAQTRRHPTRKKAKKTLMRRRKK